MPTWVQSCARGTRKRVFLQHPPPSPGAQGNAPSDKAICDEIYRAVFAASNFVLIRGSTRFAPRIEIDALKMLSHESELQAITLDMTNHLSVRSRQRLSFGTLQDRKVVCQAPSGQFCCFWRIIAAVFANLRSPEWRYPHENKCTCRCHPSHTTHMSLIYDHLVTICKEPCIWMAQY